MRQTFLSFSLLAFLTAAVPATAQPMVTLQPDSTTVAPGGSTWVNYTISNLASGAFAIELLLALDSGANLEEFTSNPLIAFVHSILGQQHRYRATGTLPAGSSGEISGRFKLSLSLNAFPGGSFPLTMYAYNANLQAVTYKNFFVEPAAGAPKLTIQLKRVTQLVEPNDNGTFDVDYEIVITNVGDAATSGDVSLKISRPAFLPSANWRPGFIFAEASTSQVLQPQGSWTLQAATTFPLVRGSWFITGEVSGGGSPTAQGASDPLKVDPRLSQPLNSRTPAATKGRGR